VVGETLKELNGRLMLHPNSLIYPTWNNNSKNKINKTNKNTKQKTN
jgi:hypothetical protein